MENAIIATILVVSGIELAKNHVESFYLQINLQTYFSSYTAKTFETLMEQILVGNQ